MRAAEYGYETLALTDHDNVCGAMELAQACKDLGAAPDPRRRADRSRDEDAGLPPDGAGRVGHRLAQPLPAATSRRPTPATRPQRGRRGRRPSPPCSRSTRWRSEARASSASPAAPATAPSPAPGTAASRTGPRRARRLLAIFGRERLRVELQRPLWRHDRARNRGSSRSPSGSASPAWRPATSTPTTAVGPSSRTRWSPSAPARRSRSPSPCGAATRARSSPRRARWRRASPSTPRRSPRPRGSPSGCASTSRSELGYRYPGSEDPEADATLAEICRGRMALRYDGHARAARGGAAPRRGAAGDRRPRALRLLPPALRPARARPRGRRRGPRPRLGAQPAAAGTRARLERQLGRLLSDRPLARRSRSAPGSSSGASSTTRSPRCPTSTSTSPATSARS